MFTNKVGLEAEYLLTDKKGNLVFPSDYDLDTDEFAILGEFRGEPGETSAETTANFLKEYYSVKNFVEKENLVMCLNGWSTISPEFYSQILRRMGGKELPLCKNIYNIDILNSTDAIVEDGIIKGHRISCGLHIHFSSSVTETRKITFAEQDVYSPVNIPFSINGVTLAEMKLFKLERTTKESTRDISVSANRITNPVIEFIVKSMDKKIFPLFKINDVKLKFRQVGFYELKNYGGFEYRSLPFNDSVLSQIYSITDYAFSLLESL